MITVQSPQRSLPALEHLRLVLNYDAATGVFRWRVSHQKVKVGDVAGGTATGYVLISVKGKRYKAHRLAWLYHYGVSPCDEIDHKNGMPCDNRISNLREATHRQNSKNLKTPTSNTSGIKGVGWYKPRSKWRARITADCKVYHLGLFETRDAAEAAYKAKAVELHGEFARAS